MAAKPLIDLDAIDLDTVIATQAELYRFLKQRNRFEVLSGLLHHDVEGGVIVGYTDVRKDAWWAEDHIPGRPIFPGALMVEAGAQLCTYDVHQRRDDMEEKFVGFGGLDRTRFRMTVEPDCRLLIVGCTKNLRSRMFTYSVQGFVERTLAFEAEIMGVIV